MDIVCNRGEFNAKGDVADEMGLDDAVDETFGVLDDAEEDTFGDLDDSGSTPTNLLTIEALLPSTLSPVR